MTSQDDIFKSLNIQVDENQPLCFKEIVNDTMNCAFDVYCECESILSVDYYQHVLSCMEKSLEGQIDSIKLYLCPQNNNLKDVDKKVLLDYVNYFFNQNNKLKNVLKQLNIQKIETKDNDLVIDVPIIINQTSVDTINKYFVVILNRLGLEFNQVMIRQTVSEEEFRAKMKQQQETYNKQAKQESKPQTPTSCNFGNIPSNMEVEPIIDIIEDPMPETKCLVCAEIIKIEIIEAISKRGNPFTKLDLLLHDDSGNIKCSTFLNDRTKANAKLLKKGMVVNIAGTASANKFTQNQKAIQDVIGLELVLQKKETITRVDQEDDKRVELHLHTNMSMLNGVSSISDYVAMAKSFGHVAIAITDHDVVHAFPEAESASKKNDIKMVYGVEANVFTEPNLVFDPTDENIDDVKYCVFDVETTGLSANFNKLIEIGAVMMHNNEIIDEFQCFIKIDEPLSEFTTQLTGITDKDLSEGLELKEALLQFKEWSKDSVLVAHNATFDRQFMARNYERVLNEELTQPVIDTLELSRFVNPERTYHSLSILSKLYSVPIDESSHHRADYDAKQLAQIFVKMLNQLRQKDIHTLREIQERNDVFGNRGQHNLVYVKNQKGLPVLYQLVSDANTKYLNINPRMREKDILENRENLIYVGGGCSNGTIIDAYLNKSKDELIDIINKFDYIELLPVPQYQPLVENGTLSDYEQVKDMIKNIIKLCDSLDKKVVLNGDAHFTNQELLIAKEIVKGKTYKPNATRKIDGEEVFVEKQKYNEWREQNSLKNEDQYFKTTSEMLERFNFIDNAKQYIVDNPKDLVSQVEEVKIIPDKLFTPTINGVDEKTRNMVYETARKIYGEELPEIVEARIEKELKAIIGYGYAVIYYICSKLVKYSLKNGYLVGSRGSVGSSLVAFLMEISEVNPLIPHYVCPNCKYSEFIEDGSVASGYDLDIKMCPCCGEELIRDGQDIPFETFLGFEGDKVPDIDLNFSGEFQAQAHDFIHSKDKLDDPELFDDTHAYRAGTISTVADKYAYAYTRNYFELIDQEVNNATIEYNSLLCLGIKTGTGQHPGGVIVVPEELSIFGFTPVQYPANKKESAWMTTHFDFHSIHDNLLKFDILGHDDPTMLRRLQLLTGVDPQSINITDEKIMELFSSTKSLNFIEDIDQEIGTLGVPEFGTQFVGGMLKKTKPKTFAELVQISGLSHGTDVWTGNAESLIESGQCELKDVIGCRDDIMVYLMQKGLSPKDSFDIMEKVRKGKGVNEDEIQLMKDNNVPDWYIGSCQKIKYMFPKAHASAYVLMALRIAWYKVYEPLAYYSAYFSSRIEDFDVVSMISGIEKIKRKIDMVTKGEVKLANGNDLSKDKKEKLLVSLRMCQEMLARGFKFYRVDLEKSSDFQFLINDKKDGLIIPFSAVSGLGESEAQSIVRAREEHAFTSKEDFKQRTKVKKPTYEALEIMGVLDHLPDTDQQDLF